MKKVCLLAAVLLCVVMSAPSFAADTVRIGVCKFENRAKGLSDAYVRAITDLFVRTLANSPSISIIEQDRLEEILRQQRRSMSGIIDPRMAVEAGRLAGCQYVLLGSATKFNKNQKAQNILGLYIEAKYDVNVTLDARLIDTKTGEVVMSVSESGYASQKKRVSKVGDLVQKGEDIDGGLEESAIEQAVSRISQRVMEVAVEDYMQVLGVGGNDVTLGIGAISGARKGALYRVNADGDEVRDMKGNVIGRRSKTVAIVQIVEVDNEFSIAHVIKDGGSASSIRRGDKLRAISSGEAEDLIKNGGISKFRSGSLGDLPSPDPDPDPIFDIRPIPPSLENNSTNPEVVVPTYGLPAGETKARIQLHKNLQRAGRNRNAYNHYIKMVEDSDGKDYLAAYQAGMTARALGMKKEAIEWFDKALAINPNYVPAQQAKTAPTGSSGKKRKK